MRNAFIFILSFAAVGSLAACDSFVNDVGGPIDRVVSDSLDTQEAVSFLATGVEEGFNDAYDAHVRTCEPPLRRGAVQHLRGELDLPDVRGHRPGRDHARQQLG